MKWFLRSFIFLSHGVNVVHGSLNVGHFRYGQEIWHQRTASQPTLPFLSNSTYCRDLKYKLLLPTYDLTSKWMTTLLNHSRKFHSKVTVQRLTIETASNRKFMSNCHKNLVLKLLGLQTLYSWRSQGNCLLPIYLQI